MAEALILPFLAGASPGDPHTRRSQPAGRARTPQTSRATLSQDMPRRLGVERVTSARGWLQCRSRRTYPEGWGLTNVERA